jgi:precorrin-6B methylase 2
MKVLDVGCGQGTFTVCIARLVGKTGKVTSVDITDENLDALNQNLQKYRVRPRVAFVKADATKLGALFAPESFDIAFSYRLIEELNQLTEMPEIISSMVRVIRRTGSVVILELSTETKNPAQENLIRLHRDIGHDYFPPQSEILSCLQSTGLKDVKVEKLPTNYSYSGEVFLKSNISQDEIWPEFKETIMKKLWPSIKRYGMKYPDINKYSGQKS